MVSVLSSSLDSLPLFVPPGERQAASSFDRAFAQRPIETVVGGYQTHGSIFRINHHGEDRVAMAGVEANRFIWGDNELWDYPTARCRPR